LSTLGGTQIILDVETGESRAVSSFYDNWDSDRYSESSALSAPPQHWLPMVGEEVPPQFRDAYINERPTNYINDPQHLLAKEVRTRLAESLRNSSLIRNRDTQVLILDRNQEFPPGGIGQPGPFNILTDFGTRRVIAYFLGDLDRARSGSRSVRIPEAGNRSPSFELMTFLDLLDAPMEPRSKFADMANPNAVEGDPNFDDTDDWNVVAVGGRHVLPVAQFEPEFRQSRSPGPASDDWVVYKVDNTDTLHSLLVGGAYDFRSDVDGHVTATLTGAMGGELGGQTKPAVPVYSTTSYDRVAEILVKEGDEVWRDTPLIKLRGHTAAVKIRNAGVDLEAAETALDALEPDSDDRGRLQREVKRSRAALEKAASELVDLTLRSPAHGKVIKVDATVGEAPAYGTPVVVIQPE
ncbi:MAG: hypothetical protein KDN22_21535, partial [Verrucomicrobiae bacterium]|nr:hypothetical protein [Verrucomicrobiae bacterium]